MSDMTDMLKTKLSEVCFQVVGVIVGITARRLQLCIFIRIICFQVEANYSSLKIQLVQSESAMKHATQAQEELNRLQKSMKSMKGENMALSEDVAFLKAAQGENITLREDIASLRRVAALNVSEPYLNVLLSFQSNMH